MIFVARLLQEKCREQHRNLLFAFIELTKAIDTVGVTLDNWGTAAYHGGTILVESICVLVRELG